MDYLGYVLKHKDQVEDAGYDVDSKGNIVEAGERLWSMKIKEPNPYSYRNNYFKQRAR